MTADQPAAEVLVTVSGQDRAGVTAALFDVLSPLVDAVLDIEQVVIRDRLTLGILVSSAGGAMPLHEALAPVAHQLALDVTVADAVAARHSVRRARHHVTVLGSPLTAAAMGAVVRRIADCGANIDSIVRLSRYPLMSFELQVSGGDETALRGGLSAVAVEQQIDVAVQRASIYRRAKRLVVMDVDSTLIQGEVIELLAAHAGCEAEVASITERAMAGQLDFEQSLRARVSLLAGLDAAAVDKVRDEVVLTRGAATLVRTLKRLGFSVAIVSGGFTQVTDALVDRLGLDYAAANTLEIVDGRLTGGLVGAVVDRPGKAAALRRFAALAGVPVTQTVAIGDGANDLDMLEAAGLGIAFNAKPVVREAADASLNQPYLDAILFLLGISREEVEAADAEDLA